MELYRKHNEGKFVYEEDKHYSFIEYGGSCVVHFNFDENNDCENHINIQSISKNNFLIADNDGFDIKLTDKSKDIPEKKKRLMTFKKIFKNNFFAEQREIENIITPEIYVKSFKKKYRGRKYRLKDSPNLELAKKNINNKSIGSVLIDYIIDENSTTKSTDVNKMDISIVEDKPIFCKKICSLIDEENITFKDLSEDAQKLTIELKRFIQENN